MSPFRMMTALPTGEIHGDSVGTRQQLMASVHARHQGLLGHCGSHIDMAAISDCLS